MKYFLLFGLIFSCLAPASAFAQDSTESDIKEIRTRYSEIENKAKASEKFSVQAEDGPEEGDMTRYLLNGELVKIHISFILGDHGGSDEYYYFQDGELFFVYKSDSHWRFSGEKNASGEPGTIDVVTEYRVYWKDGGVIRALKKEASSTDPDKLADLLKKQENKISSDADINEAVMLRAAALQKIKTRAGWRKFLLNGLR